MVDRNIVTWSVPHRAPVDWHLAQRKQLARILIVGEIFHFEGNVVHLRLRTAYKIYRVMVRVAAKKNKKVLDPVRHPKAQHAAVEISHRLRVLNDAGDMAELKRPGSQCLMVGTQIVPLREQLNRSASGIAESQHLADTRDCIAERLASHAILCQGLRNVAEI